MGPIWALCAIFMLVPCGLFDNGPTWWQHFLPRLKPSLANALPIWLPINNIVARLGQYDNTLIWFRHIETRFSQCNIPFKWKATLAPCRTWVTFCLSPLAHQTILFQCWPNVSWLFGFSLIILFLFVISITLYIFLVVTVTFWIWTWVMCIIWTLYYMICLYQSNVDIADNITKMVIFHVL